MAFPSIFPFRTLMAPIKPLMALIYHRIPTGIDGRKGSVWSAHIRDIGVPLFSNSPTIPRSTSGFVVLSDHVEFLRHDVGFFRHASIPIVI